MSKHFVPDTPIRIEKGVVFNKVVEVTDTDLPYIDVGGYASKMIDIAGDIVIDADQENVNTMGIDTRRLLSSGIPLLYGHDQKSVIGQTTKVEYRADGLYIEGRVQKLPGDDLTNYVYESIKAGNLKSFSVGLLVKAFDVVSKGNDDYLQLAESELIEISILGIPSNSLATFDVLSVKGINRLGITKSALKAENPNICKDIESCMLSTQRKGKDVAAAVEVKALTFDETMNSSWMRSREFDLYLTALRETIEDNWYENLWFEQSPEDTLANVKEAFDKFIAKQEEMLSDNTQSTNPSDGDAVMSSQKGIDLNVKTVADEETTLQEGSPAPEAKEQTPTAPEAVEEVTATEGDVVVEPVVVEPEPQPDNKPEPQEPADALGDLIEKISAVKVEELSDEDLERFYESISTTADSVQAVVVNLVATEIRAGGGE